MAQLSVLDLIERKTSVLLNITEDIVAKVIRHKWKAVNEATYLHTTVEDSGLGKWSTRTKKIIKRIEKVDEIINACTNKLQRDDLSDKERAKLNNYISTSQEEKEYLKTKLDGL